MDEFDTLFYMYPGDDMMIGKGECVDEKHLTRKSVFCFVADSKIDLGIDINYLLI